MWLRRLGVAAQGIDPLGALPPIRLGGHGGTPRKQMMPRS
jgi:hypothetical protein